MASTHHLIAASRVEGTPVFSAKGDKLGKIVDLLIEKVSGKAVYGLMSFDGFMGAGQRYFPVPWALLDYDEAKGGYATPLTRELIENGHSVGDHEVADEVTWREQVHSYYSVAPYWVAPATIY